MALSKQEDLSQYAPRLMQSWHKCIKKDDPKNELQDLLYLMLIEIVKQVRKRLLAYFACFFFGKFSFFFSIKLFFPKLINFPKKNLYLA